jgi:hypothetical protein
MMNKVLPFLFPAAALLIVLFLAFRWYSLDRANGEIGPVNEGVEIEDLTQEQRQSILRGTPDSKTVVLQPETEDSVASGDIRYEIENDKVLFSVDADLPPLKEGQYQVWLRSGSSMSPAFTLSVNKGGYMGSAAINIGRLPVEVSVSRELESDQTIEEVVLRGTISE